MTTRIWPGLIAGAAVLAAASAASAQEGYSWTGFYIGGHAGGDWRRSEIDPFNEPVNQLTNAFVPGRGIVVVPGTTVAVPGTTIKDDGWTWGGQAGFAFQSGAWVFGAEGDISKGGDGGAAQATFSVPPTILEPTKSVTVSRSVESEWDWSARARLGYAWDRYQIYATGGLAGAKLRVSALGIYANPGGQAAAGGSTGPTVTITGWTNTTGGSVEDDRTGWTLGGGGEWAVSDRISVGVEYRHTDLGSETYNIPAPFVGSPSVGTITSPTGSTTSILTPGQIGFAPTRIHHTDDAITLRVNVRFGM